VLEKSQNDTALAIGAARPKLVPMEHTQTAPAPTAQAPVVQVDIISDVMCPWCIVGFQQLHVALSQVGCGAQVRWHPFELNPDMEPEGELLSEHIQRKYGITAEESAQNRQKMQDMGSALGFTFNFSDRSRIVNSFQAHLLLDFAATVGLQHPLKMALFQAHFTDGRDVSDEATLLDIAVETGLERIAATEALASEAHAGAVRGQQQVWRQNGISGVPSMIFAEKYLLTGAQGPQNYAGMLQKVLAEMPAA